MTLILASRISLVCLPSSRSHSSASVSTCAGSLNIRGQLLTRLEFLFEC